MKGSERLGIKLASEHVKKLETERDNWKELAHDMYIWLDSYMKASPTLDKSHPVNSLIYRYEKMDK